MNSTFFKVTVCDLKRIELHARVWKLSNAACVFES
jgi:hypothetical protein